MKKVLLITDVDFWLKGAGHRMRISALIEFLVEHVELTIIFIGVATRNMEQQVEDSLKAKFIVLEKEKILDPHEYGILLSKLFRKKSFDSIIIEYIHNTYFLKYLNIDNSTIILDAHDIISDRTNDFIKFNYSGYSYEMPQEIEFKMFDIYDHIMVLCDKDFEKINSILDSSKAILCPHPVAIVKHSLKNKVENIAFIASEYLPNIDGIQHFIQSCWTRISSLYSVKLSLYGNICKRINIQLDNSICLKGYVDNLFYIYDDSDIIINPVRFGAGLKIKSIEALANGKPLITTSHGARGLETAKDIAYLVADDKDAFIKACSILIENLHMRAKLSENAYEFINNKYSPNYCFEPLLKVIM